MHETCASSAECCQLLAKFSGQSEGKFGRGKKIRTLFNLTYFLKAFGRLKICFLCLRALGKVSHILICTELDRIRGEKTIFKKFSPLFALSVQIGQKFIRSRLGRSNFYSALFEL
jgi:hypothetical protein